MASKSQQESAAAQNRQPVRRDYDASRESPSLAAAVEMEDKDTPEVQTETEAAPVELLPTEERDMFGKLRHGAAVALDTILHPRSVDKQEVSERGSQPADVAQPQPKPSGRISPTPLPTTHDEGHKTAAAPDTPVTAEPGLFKHGPQEAQKLVTDL